MQVNDRVKMIKLEWIFGLPELLCKKTFTDTNFKYGGAFATRINEDVIAFNSPLLYGSQDEALLA